MQSQLSEKEVVCEDLNNLYVEASNELTELKEKHKRDIEWVLKEYINCVNDSDAITEKLEEMLNETHKTK